MVDHVPKPFEPSDLIRTIARHRPDKIKDESKDIRLGDTKFNAEPVEEGGAEIDLKVLNDLEEMFDHDYVVTFLQTHMGDVTRFVDDIEQEGPSGDINIVHHRAHELKSISAMFGLAKLSELAEVIERACVEGREEEARRLAQETRERYVANLSALQKFYPVQIEAA